MRTERQSYIDRVSKVEVTQLTDYKGHSHHFYFTNAGWYARGRKLLFSSERNNRRNLFGVDLEIGAIEQLTDINPPPDQAEPDILRACMNPIREEVYFWQGATLHALDLASRAMRPVFVLEPGWGASILSCSADGRYLCFASGAAGPSEPHVDRPAGYVGMQKRWEAMPHCRIMRVPADGGEAQVLFEEHYWIGHVNTSPTLPHLLTFCHEGPWDKVDNRIWGLDMNTGKAWKIRPTDPGETVGHEYWFSDGIRIGYHGQSAQGKPMLGSIRFDNTERHEHDFPGQTGHIFSLDDDLIVGDGGGVIRVWKREGDGYAGPRVLCRHDSGMRTQESHPHPRISPDGRYVVFTSDRSRYCNVYAVPLAQFDALPMAKD